MRRPTLSAALMALLGCMTDGAHDDRGSAPPETSSWAAPEHAAEVVVLIAVDGVRWQEVFAGVEPHRALAAGLPPAQIVDAARLMPHLHALATESGAALGGSRAPDCRHNDCPRVTAPTVADELADDGDPGRVAVFASWPMLARAVASAPERVLLSVGRDGTNDPSRVVADDPIAADLYEAGERASPAPSWGRYRPDRHTAALATHYLRRERPRFLFIGLGDSDEHAHHDDYAGYLEALRRADAVIGEVAAALQQMSAEGTPTLLLVTTDHGRGTNFVDHGAAMPESARVWLVASGDAVRARGHVASPEPRYLADITATVRALTGVESATSSPGTVLGELFAYDPRRIAAR